jgi:hypothetical protein
MHWSELYESSSRTAPKIDSTIPGRYSVLWCTGKAIEFQSLLSPVLGFVPMTIQDSAVGLRKCGPPAKSINSAADTLL